MNIDEIEKAHKENMSNNEATVFPDSTPTKRPSPLSVSLRRTARFVDWRIDMKKLISEWWNHDAQWWQFWWPGSGLFGGLIMGAALCGCVLVFVC